MQRSQRTNLFFSLILVSTVAAGAYYLTYANPFPGIRFPTSLASIMSTTTSSEEWRSDHEGWFTSLPTAQPDPESFFPAKENILLAVLQNSRVEPEGFTLAILSSPTSPDERLVIDAQGRLFKVATEDSRIQAILSLASTVSTLPKPDMFRNTWMVRSPITGQPIERIIVPDKNGGFDQTSVSGFKKERGARPELKERVGDEYDSLPKELGELTGLVLEAREGYQNGQAGVLVRRVVDLLPDDL